MVSDCQQAASEPAARPLPWFGAVQGFALVPPEGSLGAAFEPAAAVVLTEGGQLMVHDLKSLQPLPLSLPFQELPPVTASLFLPGEVGTPFCCERPCMPPSSFPLSISGMRCWEEL